MKKVFAAVLLCLPTISLAEETKVCFYEHNNFEGEQVCYTGNQSGIALNDKITSLRLYGNAYVEVFEDGNYSGDRTVIMMDSYKLDFLNDKISSFKIHTRRTNDFACFYEHPGFNGTPHCALAGASVSDLQDLRNKPSSLFIVGDARVQAYSYPNLDSSKKNDGMYRTFGHLGDMGWNDDVDSFSVHHWIEDTDGWDNKRRAAIHAQEQLGSHARLNDTNAIGSHNSYNSDDYLTAGSGENHRETIAAQLDMGARIFELDIHGTKLCHTPDCWQPAADVQLARLLAEIKNWLIGADDNDFIMIKIEDHMDNNTNRETVAGIFRKSLGSLLATRSELSQHFSLPSVNNTGRGLVEASVREIIKTTGKRVMLFGNEWTDYGNSSYADLLFGYSYNEPPANDFTATECPGSLTGNWNSNSFSIAVEDLRYSVAVIGLRNEVQDNAILKAIRCGLNVVGADELTWDDSAHFWGHIWSWRDGSFTQSGDQCALWAHNTNKMSNWKSCDTQRQVVCRLGNGQLALADQTATWSQGQAQCEASFPNDDKVRFSLPLTAKESTELSALNPSSGGSWVNYKRIGTDWVANIDQETFWLRERQLLQCVQPEGNFEGAKLIVRECNDTNPNQNWYYDHSTSLFHNPATGKCMDNSGQRYNGGTMKIWNCDANNRNQRFEWAKERIHLRDINYSYLTLDVNTGNRVVTSQTVDGGKNQIFDTHYELPDTNLCPHNNASFDGANCYIYKEVSGVNYWDYAGGRYYSPSSEERQKGQCYHSGASFDGANCYIHKLIPGVGYWSYANGRYYNPVYN